MPNYNRTYIYLLLIIILGLVVAGLFYSGPLYIDDQSLYITYSYQLLQGNLSVTTSTPYKIGLLPLATIAISESLFGVSSLSYVLPTLLELVLIIILTFLVGKEFFDVKTGLLGSLLIPILPFVLQYATSAFPDMLLGVLAGLSIYLLIVGLKKKKDNILLISGLVAGLMLSAKLGGVGFGVILILTLALRDRKYVKAFSIGYFTSVIGYLILLYIASNGNLFPVLSSYSIRQVTLAVPNSNNGALYYNIYWMLDMISGAASLSAPLFKTYPLGITLILVIIGSAVALTKLKRRGTYLVSSFWLVFLYLFLGSESITSYQPIVFVDRYLLIVVVPLVLLISAFLVFVYDFCLNNIRKSFAIMAVVAIISALLISNLQSYGLVYNYNNLISEQCLSYIQNNSVITSIYMNESNLSGNCLVLYNAVVP